MADWNYDDFELSSPDEGEVARWINWVGAAMSLLLIAGLAVWGWKLMVRDVTGVPVVRAMDTPMRVAPGDPGGEAAEYQGLAVNSIAAESIQNSRVDAVTLAPPSSGLSDEDQAMAALAPAEEETLAAVPEDAVEVTPAPVFGSEMTPAVAVEPEPTKEPSATDLAVAAALAGIDTLEPTPAVLLSDDLGGAGPVRSPRPSGRPAGLRTASLTPTVDPAIMGEVDPATIPPGTWVVQLGAYSTPEIARLEWANALSLFGDYMAGKERIVQRAETGGRAFWRLRAHGFADLADARRFCAVLSAEGANCIPAEHR